MKVFISHKNLDQEIALRIQTVWIGYNKLDRKHLDMI